MTRVQNTEGETVIWPSVTGGVWLYYSHLDRLEYYPPHLVKPLATHFLDYSQSELAKAILEAVSENIH
jgi:hypothetical protein